MCLLLYSWDRRNFTTLRKITLNKAVGADGISQKILKEMAYYLVAPLAGIINSSLRQVIVPYQWKISRVTPIPKVFPPKDVELMLNLT